jgi:hypothetical protein
MVASALSVGWKRTDGAGARESSRRVPGEKEINMDIHAAMEVPREGNRSSAVNATR